MSTPRISRITLFPIKSLDGVDVTQALLSDHGALVDDRRWAMFDDAGRRFVNGKNHAAVHAIRSRFDLLSRTVTLTDSRDPHAVGTCFELDDHRGDIESWLSDAMGFRIHLHEDHARGFPDDTHSPGPTVISTGTLEEISRWFALPVEQIRARFRTNIEIDGVPPFWEDRLFRGNGEAVPFCIGNAKLLGINPCQRCIVPARDPVSGALDAGFALRFAELRQRTRPDWSNPDRFNHFFRVAINTRATDTSPGSSIALGDHVTLPGTVPTYPAPDTRPGTSPPEFWAGAMVIDAVMEEAPDVRTFRLRPEDGGHRPFSFQAGQFASLVIEHGEQRFRRAYTLASSPLQATHCEITVKRDGAASSLLHDHFVPGMRLHISGPFGEFGLPGVGTRDLLLIAGGVGITPLMSKLRYLADIGWSGRVDLVQVVRHRENLIFADELTDMAVSRLPGLRVHPFLTDPDCDWPGFHGRLTAGKLLEAVPDAAKRAVRVCGPTGMAAATQAILASIGLPDAQYASESFGDPGATPEPADLTTQTIHFAKSHVSIDIDGAHTLLDAAGLAGIALESGCLAGVCGRCKIKLLDGPVSTGCEVGLSPASKAQGYVLACQSSARGPLTVDA
jgi:ferredoxin-NADP reductase/uncharacterized protein YcbX